MVKESTTKTLLVAFILCVVCSMLVSSAAVVMRPRQVRNKELDIKKKLLTACSLIKETETDKTRIDLAFQNVKPLVIELDNGRVAKGIDPTAFDQRKADRSPEALLLPQGQDRAGIRSRSRLALVYLVKKDDQINQIVLPVHGRGLYSTLYGFLALATDTKTVTGFTFYDQGETPGLGGEVENPRWKALWPGKTLFDKEWRPNIKLVKGGPRPGSPEADHQVDALSGATMTSRGVENLLHYWLGANGYGPFLARVRADDQFLLERQ